MPFIVQSLSRVPLFTTPWTAAHQASLSFAVSQSLLMDKAMATHSSIPPWEIPRTEEAGGLQPTEPQKSQTWLSD